MTCSIFSSLLSSCPHHSIPALHSHTTRLCRAMEILMAITMAGTRVGMVCVPPPTPSSFTLTHQSIYSCLAQCLSPCLALAQLRLLCFSLAGNLIDIILNMVSCAEPYDSYGAGLEAGLDGDYSSDEGNRPSRRSRPSSTIYVRVCSCVCHPVACCQYQQHDSSALSLCTCNAVK